MLKLQEPQGHKVTFWFTIETWEQLKKFITDNQGVKRALSITVEEAVKAYLVRQKGG